MDRSLGISLDVAVKLIAVIDYLLDIWPCPGKQAGLVRHSLLILNMPFFFFRGKPEGGHD